MSEGNQVEKVATNYINMKKAGMPTVLIVVMTLLSSPGLWTYFFDKSRIMSSLSVLIVDFKRKIGSLG